MIAPLILALPLFPACLILGHAPYQVTPVPKAKAVAAERIIGTKVVGRPRQYYTVRKTVYKPNDTFYRDFHTKTDDRGEASLTGHTLAFSAEPWPYKRTLLRFDSVKGNVTVWEGETQAGSHTNAPIHNDDKKE